MKAVAGLLATVGLAQGGEDEKAGADRRWCCAARAEEGSIPATVGAWRRGGDETMLRPAACAPLQTLILTPSCDLT